MIVKKITIVGNSCALRTRPHVKEESQNYGQLLQNQLNESSENTTFIVENLAMGRATMDDLDGIQDQIINSFGDLYLINIGVSDAATREIPYWFANILNERKSSFKQKIFKGIHQVFFKNNRSFWVKLRGKRAWVSPKKFRKKYAKLIETIHHNTSGKVICFSLLPPDERVEKEVPGTKKNYAKFNDIIQEICKKKEVIFLDMNHLTPDPHYPDGTHFSQEGNKEAARMVLELIQEKGLL